MNPPTPVEIPAVLGALKSEIQLRKSQNKLAAYIPYAKQREFHANGANFRERLLMAGNQLGKTLCAGAEVAMHATGRYPDWWIGRRLDRPVNGWVSGVTGESTRDNPQRILYGQLGKPGTGMIPKGSIADRTVRRGLADALDTLSVHHVTGGTSLIGFKSYDQGREKWQGPTLDFVWFDEEPPEDIYTEGLTRTNVGLGPVMLTFTPLLGMSNVVKRYLIDKSLDRIVTQMTIEDALHYSESERSAIIASYPLHERDARAKGIPTMGSGRVFPVIEEDILCDAFQIPEHWPVIGGLDFGWDHPSAGIKLAWDRDADVLYLIAEHRQREQTPAMFAASIRPWGDWFSWAWPHDGLQHDKGSGLQLAKLYRDQKITMLGDYATFENGSNGLEAGISEMLDRMQTGRWKVFRHLNYWIEEFRLYHRKDGLIVKLTDDLISASRYAMMMRRHARTKQKTTKSQPRDSGVRDGWMR